VNPGATFYPPWESGEVKSQFCWKFVRG
jgi:hypothetical protein